MQVVSLLLLFALFIPKSVYTFRVKAITLSTKSKLLQFQLLARVSRTEEDAKAEQAAEGGSEDSITIPYKGLMDFEQGRMFSQPLKEYDPLDDIDDLPGEEGSDEKLAAIQKRIEDRVAALRKSGEWNDEEIQNYGRDPLRDIPLPNVIAMQIKAVKPFESPSDLALNYILLIITTIVIGGYVAFLRDNIESLMNWYVGTDFDSDFLSNLLDANSE